jgi:hypothetical protein
MTCDDDVSGDEPEEQPNRTYEEAHEVTHAI